MRIFIDTSVLVAVALGNEPKSGAASDALESNDEAGLTIDTTIATETFLVLRSKIGSDAARSYVEKALELYGYRAVAKATMRRALALVDGSRLGDALITENVRSNRATLLTLDRKQADLLGDQARLVV